MSTIYDYPGAHDKATYDLENRIADPERRIEAFIESICPLDGLIVADIGAGGGYHAALYARQAAHVFAIEPAPKMLAQLHARLAEGGQGNISVIAAGAESIPLKDNLADVIHSRFAYFFGPEQPGGPSSCEPGIREAMRILRPGGYFFIVDNALDSGQFAGFLERFGYSSGGAAEAQRANDEFYEKLGFARATIASTWTAPDRDLLRQVVAMEFPAGAVDKIMAEVDGAQFSYHYRVYYIQK